MTKLRSGQARRVREDQETGRQGGAREVTAKRRATPGEREAGGEKTGGSRMKEEEATTQRRRGVLKLGRKGGKERGEEAAMSIVRGRRGGMDGLTEGRRMTENLTVVSRQT